MAVDKDKVMSKLNEKLKGRSVTKDYKTKLAEKWAAKIETDDDIESYIDDRTDDILEAAAEADRRAKSAADKAKEEAAKAVKGETPKSEEKVEYPDMPDYMKAFMKNVDDLKSEIGTLKAEKSQQSLADKFKSDERFKNIPESMMKRYIPSKEEDFEANATELAETWKSLDVQTKGFGSDKPNASGKKITGDGEPSKENVDAVMANLNI